MSGSGGRRNKREWVACLHNNSLAVVSSGAGLEAPIRTNELSIKWLPSQGLRCREIMASAANETLTRTQFWGMTIAAFAKQQHCEIYHNLQ